MSGPENPSSKSPEDDQRLEDLLRQIEAAVKSKPPDSVPGKKPEPSRS